jgi:hypothetical protein
VEIAVIMLLSVITMMDMIGIMYIYKTKEWQSNEDSEMEFKKKEAEGKVFSDMLNSALLELKEVY